ncbi:hypothetical protein Tco_0871389 [Tanacetum coccineum]
MEEVGCLRCLVAPYPLSPHFPFIPPAGGIGGKELELEVGAMITFMKPSIISENAFASLDSLIHYLLEVGKNWFLDNGICFVGFGHLVVDTRWFSLDCQMEVVSWRKFPTAAVLSGNAGYYLEQTGENHIHFEARKSKQHLDRLNSKSCKTVIELVELRKAMVRDISTKE